MCIILKAVKSFFISRWLSLIKFYFNYLFFQKAKNFFYHDLIFWRVEIISFAKKLTIYTLQRTVTPTPGNPSLMGPCRITKDIVFSFGYIN